jgi:hypothetical protein
MEMGVENMGTWGGGDSGTWGDEVDHGDGMGDGG